MDTFRSEKHPARVASAPSAADSVRSPTASTDDPGADQRPSRFREGTLPRRRRDAITGSTDPAGDLDVLIVDDDPAAIAHVREILTQAGHSVAAVLSGEEALRLAPILRPRLVLLDVKMPGLDGYRVAHDLQALSATSGAPILFLSSSADAKDRLAGLHAGGIDFLTKPLAPAELAARVAAHLEMAALREALARRNAELAAVNASLRAGLDGASRVQDAMLPRRDAVHNPIRFAWRCVQCEQLGGDAVNTVRLSDRQVGGYLLDASGHGVPASLLSVSTSCLVAALTTNLLSSRHSDRSPSPAAILSDVNRVVRHVAPSGMFVTLVFAVIDVPGRRAIISSAGHPGPLIIRGSGERHFVDSPAPPAGICDWTYAETVVPFRPGDRLLLYSDGVYEQRNEGGEQFGRRNIARSVAVRASASLDDGLDELLERFRLWRGSRPVDDDVSLLAMEFPREDGVP